MIKVSEDNFILKEFVFEGGLVSWKATGYANGYEFKMDDSSTIEPSIDMIEYLGDDLKMAVVTTEGLMDFEVIKKHCSDEAMKGFALIQPALAKYLEYAKDTIKLRGIKINGVGDKRTVEILYNREYMGFVQKKLKTVKIPLIGSIFGCEEVLNEVVNGVCSEVYEYVINGKKAQRELFATDAIED